MGMMPELHSMTTDPVSASNDADTDATFHIRRPVWGMTCAACSVDLTNTLAALPGVFSVQVNPASHWIDVQVNTQPDNRIDAQSVIPRSGWISRINDAIRPHGCHLLDDSPDAQRDASRRMLRQSLFRLLLAALLWMQIMMYAWPEYSTGMGEGLTGQDISLLRWAQWMLSLPLMIFCARPVLRSAWQGLRRGKPGLDLPAAFALVAAFLVSTQATFSGQGPVWFDSLSMFLMFLLGAGYLREWLRHQSLMAVLDTQADLPRTVYRLNTRLGWQAIDLADLRVGDICRAQAGDTLAGDGVLLAQRAAVSEDLITGESRPVVRSAGDGLFAGSRLLEDTIEYRITALGANSAVGQIQQRMMQAVCSRPPQSQWVDRLSIPLLVGIVLASVLSALWFHVSGFSTHGDAGSVALAVLMASCPCAISLAAPVAWINATLQLKREGVLLRNTDALQSVCRITDVVFDKTGTLTGQAWVSEVTWFTEAQTHVLSIMHAMAATSQHPLSRALAFYLREQNVPLDGGLSQCSEIAGCGLQAVDQAGHQWRMGREHWHETGVAAAVVATVNASPGLKADAPVSHIHLTLSPAGQPASWIPVCRIDLRSGLREGAESLLDECLRQGWRLHLWSGDQQGPVAALARQLGIEDARAHMSPSDKLDALMDLRANAERVVMIGDGLNDGPALAAADVSIAMGGGSQTSCLQSDAVLPVSNLGGAVSLIAMSHRLGSVIRQNMVWAFAYNLLVIPLAASGFLTPLSAGVGMALSSLLVTFNAMRLQRPFQRSLHHGYPVSADTAVGGAGVCDRGGSGLGRELGSV